MRRGSTVGTRLRGYVDRPDVHNAPIVAHGIAARGASHQQPPLKTMGHPRANQEGVWMRASVQIRRRDAGRRVRLKCEMGGLFGPSAQKGT